MTAEQFRKDLVALLNRHGVDSRFNIPDFVLAEYLMGCLFNLDVAIKAKAAQAAHDAQDLADLERRSHPCVHGNRPSDCDICVNDIRHDDGDYAQESDCAIDTSFKCDQNSATCSYLRGDAECQKCPRDAQASPVREVLTDEDVEWVVNDNAELGVKIGDQFFFLYKGRSLVYGSGAHDDEQPMMWRPVFKREFGECCRPGWSDGKVSRSDSDQWKPLSAMTREALPAQPETGMMSPAIPPTSDATAPVTFHGPQFGFAQTDVAALRIAALTAASLLENDGDDVMKAAAEQLRAALATLEKKP